MADFPLDSSTTIDDFLNAVAAKQPAPGGGAVAGLAGALAAAIGEMVLSYSIGKKDLAEHQPALIEAARELLRARQLFLSMMVEDQSAFATLTVARKAHVAEKGSAEAKKRYDEALAACILTPCIIADTAGAVIELCERLVPMVNRFLLSDLQVCAELAMATLRSGLHNVRVNLADVDDAAKRAQIESTTAETLQHAIARIRRLLPAIDARMRLAK